MYFKNYSIGKIFIKNINIYTIKYINRRILNLSLFWKLFLFLLFLFLIIDIYQIYLYNNIINCDYNLFKIVINMAENKTKSIEDAINSLVNLQNTIANVTVSKESVQVTTTVFYTVAGMKAGLELAKNIPEIGVKSAVVLGISIAVQVINFTANKIISSSDNDNKKSFISVNMSQFFNENLNNSKINDKFSEYPYNLIPDLNIYINIEIWFIIILINVLITAYLMEKKNRYK